MAMEDQIKKAIGAHGMWKMRLNNAIEKGELDIPVEQIQKDDCCEFGKWLYGNDVTPTVKASKTYQNVKTLHADFHKVAGKVASLSTNRKDEAKNLMEGEFKNTSLKLTSEMMKWIKEING